MLARFLPQSVPFFELLAKQSTILQKQIQQLIIINEQAENNHPIEIQTLQSTKKEINQLYSTITEHLSRTFITPIDKEDIHAINLGQLYLSCTFYELGTLFFYCRIPASIPSSLKLLIANEQNMIDDILSMIKELPKKIDISSNLQEIREKKENGATILVMGFKKIQEFNFTDISTTKELFILSKYYDQLALAMEQTLNLADILEKTMIKYV